MSATLNDVEAFLLLTLSNCSLVANGTTHSGSLALECVTIQVPGSDSHLYLVLRMNEMEFPVDPTTRVILKVLDSGSRKGIVAQYADLQDVAAHDIPETVATPNIYDKADSEELRGHLVLVNQDNGEVVGEFDKKFSVQEDPILSKKGHENDPVIIEIPESTDSEHYDANALEIFARAIPPEQQDWITKSATIISHAISGSTTLLLSAISAASSSSAVSSTSTPPPLPPRAVAFLSSARTRKGLAAVHSVSGEAVKVSAKTVAIIDGMIKRAVGSGKGKGKGRSLAPPAKPPFTPSHAQSFPRGFFVPRSAPTIYELCERKACTSPAPATVSICLLQFDSHRLCPLLQAQAKHLPSHLAARVALALKARILLSADLIWSTIDNSTKRILDSGTHNLGAVVGHKYGAEAAESSLLMAGTAQNLALVYIDLRGIGRRALLRRAGKEFIKGRIASSHQ
ncbi:Senescence domain-containing protein [Mycena venus]|uniref:Senescence domain-containing protein n=1 Tax=Mycena venus TaxID=2733690 RepID=A0A8H6Y8X9_9AGAR|nr:Senescence domain-containing protein [Mycena venus]